MVGLLNAPRGTRLYQRLKKENRLLDESTGDNTDCSMNFVPKMGREKLIKRLQARLDHYLFIQAILHESEDIS